MTISLPAIDDFDYSLPEERIAKYPLPERDESKLLIFKSQDNIFERKFHALPDVLNTNDLLVFNNTKVIKARLAFQKNTGAHIEIFCLEPLNPADYYHSFQSTQSVIWKCLIGNKKKWKTGVLQNSFTIGDREVTLGVQAMSSINEAFVVEFKWNNPSVTFGELIEYAGNLPIPPYLKRKTEASDLNRYQTVYSKINGSVAAPTAGLHFTQTVFDSLKQKEIVWDEITLHVGAGTFKPVKDNNLLNHTMHTEHFIVDHNFLERLVNIQSKIVAVGTTSVRTLESLYHLGVKIKNNPGLKPNQLDITQWEAYQNQSETLSFNEIVTIILAYLKDKNQTVLHASTQIMIVPGYKFMVVDKLITNFHQPRSTLLLLIAAFVGDNWKTIYNYALKHNFRFLSYGDSSLLHPMA